MPATIDDYCWLISDAAQPWLSRVRDELGVCASGGSASQSGGCGPRSGPQPQRVTSAFLQRLRKDLSTDRTHLVVEQVELRQRAREKFSHADRMFFTQKGLEQATDELLAAHKASRFPESGVFSDLCCGIGSDLLALGARGVAIGIDRDPVCQLLANCNALACGLQPSVCGALCLDAIEAPVRKVSAWHCDPDRRVDDQRTTHLEFFEPSLDALDRLREHNPNAAIKLAPATEVPPHWWDVAEREWLGSRGECRQQVAWFASLARHPGQHAASVVAADGSSRTIVGSYSEPVPVAEQLGRYLYEPHAAVLAASLSGAVCREHGLAAVSAGIGYLTGDLLIVDAALAAFEVQEVLPFDRKRLRGWCRERSIGRLEIKKRGVKLDPRQLRAEIIAAGDNEATVIVSPLGGHVRAIVARRARPTI